LSGGRDSIVLLDAFSRLAPDSAVRNFPPLMSIMGFRRTPNAWVAFCERQCAARNLP
jgi:tRNA(Ile)-lysidine synthase TilS/MesJ